MRAHYDEIREETLTVERGMNSLYGQIQTAYGHIIRSRL